MVSTDILHAIGGVVANMGKIWQEIEGFWANVKARG
jgi:hypothetical protein